MSFETDKVKTDTDDSGIINSNEKNNIIHSIFRAAPVGIGLVINRIITEANDTLCKMTGYSMDELIGKSARILYPTDEEFEYVGIEKYNNIREKGNGSIETRWKKRTEI